MAYQYGVGGAQPSPIQRAHTPIAAAAPQGQIQPGSITYTTTSSPDGQVIYHPFKAVPASYQTAQGVVSGIQWIPAEATSVLPAGAIPADDSFHESFNRRYGDERRRDEERRRDREYRREEKERRRQEKEDDREARRAREREDRARRNSAYGYDTLDRQFGEMDINQRGYAAPAGGSPYAGGGGYPPASGYPAGGAYAGQAGGAYASQAGGYGATTPQRPVSPYQAAPVAPRPVSPYANPMGIPARAPSPYAPPGALPIGRAASPRPYGSAGVGAGRAASPYGPPPGAGIARAPSPYGPPPGAGIARAPSPYGPPPGTGIARASSPYGGIPPPSVYPPGHIMEGRPIQQGGRAISRAASPVPGAVYPPGPNPGYGYGAGASGYGAPAAGGASYAVAPYPGGASPMMPTAGSEQPMLAAPEGFSRPPNLALPYTRFDTFKIQDMEDFYENIPKMPLVLQPHDVYHEDWIRFMTDIALAWSGKLPVPEYSADGRPPKRTVLAADLIDLWNTSFFGKRGVEVVMFKGRERRSGRGAGSVELHLPGFDDIVDASDTDSSSSSSDSDEDDMDRARYGAYGGLYGRQASSQLAELAEVRRQRKEKKKLDKKRRRQEKKQRKKLKEAERTYALFVTCAGREY